MPITRVALVILLVAACAAAPRAGSHEEWAKARTIAEQHIAKTFGNAASIERAEPHVPFYFYVKAPNAYAVLVDGERVVTAKGVEALSGYLATSRMLEYRAATARDFLRVVELLNAYPPEEPNPRRFLRLRAVAALRPRLDYLAAGRVRFVLYYPYEEPATPGELREDDGSVTTYTEWTLRVDPGDPTVWTRAIRQFDHDQDRFIDVDHAH